MYRAPNLRDLFALTLISAGIPAVVGLMLAALSIIDPTRIPQ